MGGALRVLLHSSAPHLRPPAKSKSSGLFRHWLRTKWIHRNGRGWRHVAVTEVTAITGLPCTPLMVLLVLLNALCLFLVTTSPRGIRSQQSLGEKAWLAQPSLPFRFQTACVFTEVFAFGYSDGFSREPSVYLTSFIVTHTVKTWNSSSQAQLNPERTQAI